MWGLRRYLQNVRQNGGNITYEEALMKLKYGAKTKALADNEFTKGRFVKMEPDDDVKDFLTECFSQFNSLYYTLIHMLVRPILKRCMSHTEVNGFLLTGQMHLISATHYQVILETAGLITADGHQDDDESDSDESKGLLDTKGMRDRKSNKNVQKSQTQAGVERKLTLLDVGAGDGRIAERLRHLFKEVVTTEVSTQMARRLRQRGFTCYHTGDLSTLPQDAKFDVINFFNVLDRCDKPLTILRQLKRLLTPSGRVILAVPLPLNPSFESPNGWVRPAESIINRKNDCSCCCTCTWEGEVQNLISVFHKTGYEVEFFTRIPYLSQGDHIRPYYVLDDAVFILSPSKVVTADLDDIKL